MNSKFLFRRMLGVCAGVSALLVAVPVASAGLLTTATAGCTAPAVTQPFMWFGDANWYALAPGQSFDNFAGTGWALSGGAKLVSTRLYDGRTGYVLDLPAGAKAVSPPMCVTNDYPMARTMLRGISTVAGPAVYVSYLNSQGWGAAQATGTLQAMSARWTLSPALNLSPSKASGWQLAQFTFVEGGSVGEFQFYNFYVDPRMH